MKRKITALLLILTMALSLLALTGCNKGEGDEVYVQSVAAINNVGSVGLNDRFSGVVVSGNTQNVNLDESMTVDEIKVEEGQTVKRGDVLFSYNDEALQLAIEQAELELESMKNSVSSLQSQIDELNREKSNASSSERLRYTLEIQGLEADMRETNYNISTKESELTAKKNMAVDTNVRATLNGRVTTVNRSGGTDNYGNPLPFITIVETGNLRVKGTINELNRGTIMEGQLMTIRSRTDDSVTWSGTIQSIDWENPQSGGNNNMYYSDSDEMTSSSKYPFYVSLNDPQGLIIGEHVYIELGESAEVDANEVRLPSYFISDVDSNPWVWAAGSKDKLEKRTVKLGVYDDTTDEYIIKSGITMDDYVAFPDETMKAGVGVIKVDDQFFDMPAGEDYMGEGEFMEGMDGEYIEGMEGQEFVGGAMMEMPEREGEQTDGMMIDGGTEETSVEDAVIAGTGLIDPDAFGGLGGGCSIIG